jgi:DNA-3-methyladenine glycosylase
MKLKEPFFIRRNVTTIARQLLGKILVTKMNHLITSGIIVETEAYSDREKGSHAFRGITKRNEVMFERGGKAYVYLCYGVHEMFNIVTNTEGKADAVLIRALQPLLGIETMMKRMNTNSPARITSGPGKLTRSLGIDRKLNGEKLTMNKIWIEDQGIRITSSNLVCSPRIGIDYAGDDALLPWRFTIKENKWISKAISKK